jgi:hypothetical protein
LFFGFFFLVVVGGDRVSSLTWLLCAQKMKKINKKRNSPEMSPRKNPSALSCPERIVLMNVKYMGAT